MNSISQILYSHHMVNLSLKKRFLAQRIILLTISKFFRHELKLTWEEFPVNNFHKSRCPHPGQWLGRPTSETWCRRFQALITQMGRVRPSHLSHQSMWNCQVLIKAEIRWSRLVGATFPSTLLNKQCNFHPYKGLLPSRAMKTGIQKSQW